MAGIGFRLQAMVAKGSYLEATTAYLSSAIITAGPWLVLRSSKAMKKELACRAIPRYSLASLLCYCL